MNKGILSDDHEQSTWLRPTQPPNHPSGSDGNCVAIAYGGVMRHMLKIARSYFASLKASAALGRASRLRAHGRNAEALAEARRGLALLSTPHIIRLSPPEGATLVTLTMLVEQLAFEAREPGASIDDLRDSLAFLSLLARHPAPNTSEQLAWIPYLESRLAQHN